MEIATEDDDRQLQPQPLPQWVIQVTEKLNNRGALQRVDKSEENKENKCIYRVLANYYRDDDACDVYRPSVVSFGPYHHGSESCRLSEDGKSDALIHFLNRSGEQPLEVYYRAVEEVVVELKESYDRLDRVWRDYPDDFVKMMILDGCFLIEILWRVSNPRPYYASDNAVLFIHDDPSLMEHYKHDMLLLENQLPMLLLETLLKTGHNYNEGVENLKDGIAKLFSMPHESTIYEIMENKHILDVYRKGLVGQVLRGRIPASPTGTEPSSTESHDFNIPSATELHKGGIGFTTSDTTGLKHVSFEPSLRGNGMLTLPKIVVDRATKSKFLNIIAFEQVHKGAGKDVTSYISLMGRLIQDEKDVRFLRSRGIINSALPTEEVVRLFYRLSKNILLAPGDYSLTNWCLEVKEMLRIHFNMMTRGWRKDLFQTYLRSRWATLSVGAAALLLFLTFVQTLYTFLGYIHRK